MRYKGMNFAISTFIIIQLEKNHVISSEVLKGMN